MSLARLSLFKSDSFIKDTSTDRDDVYKVLLQSSSDWVALYTQRVFEIKTYEDERFTGDDTNKLFLTEWPVSENGIEVKLWDGIDSFDVEPGTVYDLVNGRYLFYPALGQTENATWANWKSQFTLGIKITYTAGYSTQGWDTLALTEAFGVPEDLEYAVAAVAHLSWMEGKKGGARRGLTSMTIAAENITITDSARFVRGLPEDVLTILDRYRRLIV